MITADWYVGLYQNSKNKDEALGKIGGDFLLQTAAELKKILIIGQVPPVEKMREILQKQEREWRRFADVVSTIEGIPEGVNPDGYAELLRLKLPELYLVLKHGVFQ